MIREADNTFPVGLNNNDCLSGCLLSLFELYGTARPFLRLYQGEGVRIGILDGHATVWCFPAQTEEAALFLQMQPDVQSIRMSADMVNAFMGLHTAVHPVLQLGRKVTAAGGTESIPARDLYALPAGLFKSFPPFDTWYPDTAYRMRHGYSHNAAIRVNGQIVSSAMTVAEWHGGALIGAVSTAQGYRQRGYASLCITELCAALQNGEKQVFIIPENELVARLYQKLGFISNGRIAIAERK